MGLVGNFGPWELILLSFVVVPQGIILLLFYLLPTLIAFSRKLPNAKSLCLINVLTGWTVIGYAFVLVWAITHQNPHTNSK